MAAMSAAQRKRFVKSVNKERASRGKAPKYKTSWNSKKKSSGYTGANMMTTRQGVQKESDVYKKSSGGMSSKTSYTPAAKSGQTEKGVKEKTTFKDTETGQQYVMRDGKKEYLHSGGVNPITPEDLATVTPAGAGGVLASIGVKTAGKISSKAAIKAGGLIGEKAGAKAGAKIAANLAKDKIVLTAGRKAMRVLNKAGIQLEKGTDLRVLGKQFLKEAGGIRKWAAKNPKTAWGLKQWGKIQGGAAIVQWGAADTMGGQASIMMRDIATSAPFSDTMTIEDVESAYKDARGLTDAATIGQKIASMTGPLNMLAGKIFGTFWVLGGLIYRRSSHEETSE